MMSTRSGFGALLVVAALSVPSVPAVANADPAAPQSNTPCSADLAGAMTWPAG